MKTLKQLFIAILTIATSFQALASENFGNISYGEAVNISGMQRMLSQRITRVYLLRLNGATGATFDKEYKSSLELFNQNFIKLSENSTGASDAVKTALNKEEQAWKAYMKVVIFEKATNVESIVGAANELLKKCHALVLAIEKDGNTDGGDAEKINTVNVSGKQRMLSQRLGLYYSAIRLAKKNAQSTVGLESVLKSVLSEIQDSYTKLSSSNINTSSFTPKFEEIKTKIDYMVNDKEKLFASALSINKITAFCNQLTALYNEVTGMYAAL